VTSRILVLGGSRSGKSRFAESLLADADTVDYLATAATRPDDAEWTTRIAAHRARRPAHWQTIETTDVAAELRRTGPAVLIDSVTLWLGAALEQADLDVHTEELCAAWAATTRQVVGVSDEVGSGVVPSTAAGRRFRDELGLLNQRLAATADEVHLVVAGLPLRLR
jgi:adenosylcobinamide kinase / adenosylcobinamide-phosphate guanylyltransferase